ncbi:CDK2-associated and cullin domain-containing protein 1-like [Eurytemora carolleeae]|uniref:CDK2-associated and cullin domain-containing protein 1-like n=1 Tax=Eurytemora carolleeae TaxID=1294199 RepID=UPI000C793D5B|nr:CDK2-associated and cullin domain-containing protein 1-like [Eurytemora carolleeae]|eukprot:XP_023339768.1 CDK2-associated and cullin domain-containing protein 1-like [Eurytemora affinis]
MKMALMEESTEPRCRSHLNVMSASEYQEKYWGRLREAIDKMLTPPPQGCRPISFEEMYSNVYSCVCKQYSERLYQDLINHMRTRVAEWSKLMYQVPDENLIDTFHDSSVQFFHASEGIVRIFLYLSRNYIETKLKTSLQEELMKIFSSMYTDLHVNRLLPLMAEAQSKPFSVQPVKMATICKQLHLLNPAYTSLHPDIFLQYLPNIGPAMTEQDLQNQREAEKRMQNELMQQGWNTQDTRRKREFEEEPLITTTWSK